jgi:hypothetical protein
MINLYKYNLDETFHFNTLNTSRLDKLKKEIAKSVDKNMSVSNLMTFCSKLYEKGYSGLDILKLLDCPVFNLATERRYELLIAFHRVRKEFRNEKILMLFILNFMFLSLELSLENISFM